MHDSLEASFRSLCSSGLNRGRNGHIVQSWTVRSAGITPAIDDRIAPVKPEGALGQASTGCGLKTFVFADIKQVFHPFCHIAIKACSDAIGDRSVLIYKDIKNRIQLGIIRQGIAVFLVLAQLRRGGLSITFGRITSPSGPIIQSR